MIAVSSEPIDPAMLLADFIADAEGAGAVASFTGVVRKTNDGGSVELLWLDHHERLTPDALKKIGAEARQRFDLTAITIVHSVGGVRAGEPIVFVAAAAPHRRAAFEAVDYAMDRIKTDAPLWKRETRDGSDHWIEARESDRADRARWEDKV